MDSPENAVIKAQAELTAAAILWRLTGLQYGCCEITVRPCKPDTCDPLTLSQVIYWDQRWGNGRVDNLGVLNYFPNLIDGQIYNISCGCPTGCCTCKADCEVRLPGPVCDITDVTIDGISRGATLFTVYDNSHLIFANAGTTVITDINTVPLPAPITQSDLGTLSPGSNIYGSYVELTDMGNAYSFELGDPLGRPDLMFVVEIPVGNGPTTFDVFQPQGFTAEVISGGGTVSVNGSLVTVGFATLPEAHLIRIKAPEGWNSTTITIKQNSGNFPIRLTQVQWTDPNTTECGVRRFVAGTPEIPAIPGTPDTPATPGSPEIPATPGSPEIPATPDIPATPGSPEIPATPGSPEIPGTPDIPATPGSPEIPAQDRSCPGTPFGAPLNAFAEPGSGGVGAGSGPYTQDGSGVNPTLNISDVSTSEFLCGFSFTLEADTATAVPTYQFGPSAQTALAVNVDLTGATTATAFGVAPGTIVTGPVTSAPLPDGTTITIVSGSVRVDGGTGAPFEVQPGDIGLPASIRYDFPAPYQNVRAIYGTSGGASTNGTLSNLQNSAAGPATPLIPAVPPTPFIPGTPTIPAVPPTPLIPAVPPTPFIPGTPLIPAVPPTPLIPAVPPTPFIPGTPAVPAVPATPDSYAVESSACCPGCQDYNKPAGEVGTWSVTYTVGVPVPAELNFAAGLYACEIAKLLVQDKSCVLPARVQSVSRQGISARFLDPDTLIERGLTGLPLVDQIIKALNPYGMWQPSRVWYPGMPRTRTETS